MTIESDTITGTLRYVNGYTGFSGDPELQSGYYLVLHAEVPEVEGVTITAKLNTETELDSDGIVIVRVPDTTKDIVITASKSGCEDVVKTLSLSDLTLEPEK